MCGTLPVLLCPAAPLPVVRSARAEQAARWFGVQRLMARIRRGPRVRVELPLPGPGQILLITGPSGSGKSRLLRALRRRLRARVRWIDLPRLRLPRRPLVDCLGDLPLEAALERLGRFGLAEVWTCLRTPVELSDGQRWRLRLALGIEQARRCGGAGDEGLQSAEGMALRAVLAADEFTALLDRTTACAVARSLRRVVTRESGLCAILTTSQEDLLAALSPDAVVECDFERWAVRVGGEGVEAGREDARQLGAGREAVASFGTGRDVANPAGGTAR